MLSVILRMRDEERNLENCVDRLLDVVSELTADFELLLLDDGSLDETSLVARQLTRRYPQVQFLRHEFSLGTDASIRSGLRHTTGELLLIIDGTRGVSAREIRELWGMRDDQLLVMVRPSDHTTCQGRSGSSRLIRRRALERLAACAQPSAHLQVQPLNRYDDDLASSTHTPRYLVRMKNTRPFVLESFGDSGIFPEVDLH